VKLMSAGALAGTAEPKGRHAMSRSTGLDADEAVGQLYAGHYRELVRLSALLLRDVGEAEEVVQDAFVAMHGRWGRLRDPDKAVAYLRQSVLNRSRSALRHRAVRDRHQPAPPSYVPSAEQHALLSGEQDAIVAALRTLPQRQREAIVLRYYADLSEADTALAMGVSRGAVKSHTSRGMAALRRSLEGQ
jgi:RNA polymerase sigma-70 factor (sigma-E family)